MIKSSLCFFYLSVGLCFAAIMPADEPFHITLNPSTPQTEFARAKIVDASNVQHALASGMEIRVDATQSPGYSIKRGSQGCLVVGSNPNEAMYGGLEVAELIREQDRFTDFGSVTRKPFISRRGIKFNIPLDARTPSYDDSGDAAQQNIIHMWDLNFWQETFDQMAINRFNVITFWNPHPFPSMIKLQRYPDVSLDNVCVTTLKPVGRENEWGEPQLVSENVVANLKTIKQISIDEKITFWKSVFKMASDRGIDVYWITWNICPNSVAKPVAANYRTYGINVKQESAGKYGVSHQIDNAATIEYVREAVKQFILTYPTIKGIGVTAGEHMPKDWEQSNREHWLWETYGEGILDAKKVQPERKVDFIHRVWYTDLNQVMKVWDKYPDRFELSFKYAKARLYSSPHVPFAEKQIELMEPFGLKCWWNLRNDDIYVHRWCDPDYVREFIKQIPLDQTAGIHMGSDGYVWGREFASRFPQEPRQREDDKHWLRQMLWGRLSYDPELNNSFFESRIRQRFNLDDAGSTQLFDAWTNASKIVPLVNRFYWKNWDHNWHVESCRGHTEGFHNVLNFAKHRAMEGSSIQTISQFVESGPDKNRETPVSVADQLDSWANEAHKVVETLGYADLNNELDATVSDINSMAWLGKYYAAKIRAATWLCKYESSRQPSDQELAIKHIQQAHLFCEEYAHSCQRQYEPQMLARTGSFNWNDMIDSAKRDIEIIANSD